jgi:hypothetical protein
VGVVEVDTIPELTRRVGVVNDVERPVVGNV